MDVIDVKGWDYRSAPYKEPVPYKLFKFKLFSDPHIFIPLLIVVASIVVGLIM